MRVGGAWIDQKPVTANAERERAHAFFTPRRDVEAVRLVALAYSTDDYFSVYDMAIQR